jgi:RimJ/RimL family protein N-acetyltransferase
MLDQTNEAIRTARLTLRPLRDSDAEPLFELFGNWEVIRWLAMPPWPYRPEHARDFIAACRLSDPDCIAAAITLDGRLIGEIGAIVKPASAVQRERGFSLGYWIGQAYWGRGYMSEAARGFIAHVFETIADDVIYSGAFTGNAASLRIQEKLGFTRDGEAMYFSNPNGREMPHINTLLKRRRFMAAA